MALDTFNPYLFVSAGEQSNKFLTPTYADGIAKFQAQRAQSITGLKVRIDPIQSGTGDPSPENIRPISGRTGMTVTAAGKNLFDQSNTNYLASDTRIYGDNDVLALSQINRLPAGTYTLSFSEKVVSLNGLEPNATRFGLYLRATNGEQMLNVNAQTDLIATTVGQIIEKTVTFTLTDDYVGKFQYFYVYTGKNDSAPVPNAYTCNIYDVQIERGASATAYEPYAGHTYPITWQTEAGTVYGGTLDVVSGVLTVDKVLIDLGSITRWRYNVGNTGAFDTNGNLNPIAKNNDCICTNYKTLENPTAGAITSGDNLVCINKKDDGTQYTGYYVTGTLVVKDSRYSDVESFKAAMNGVMLCYTLATPQTYQLTPTEVKTLAGFNQVFSDAGPVIDIKF